MALKISQLPVADTPLTGAEIIPITKGGKTKRAIAQNFIDKLLTSATVDTFSGTGAPHVFTLSVTPQNKNDTDVFILGVYQPKASYTLVGNQITINAPIAVGNIEVES